MSQTATLPSDAPRTLRASFESNTPLADKDESSRAAVAAVYALRAQ
jgi:hypothetical protein